MNNDYGSRVYMSNFSDKDVKQLIDALNRARGNDMFSRADTTRYSQDQLHSPGSLQELEEQLPSFAKSIAAAKKDFDNRFKEAKAVSIEEYTESLIKYGKKLDDANKKQEASLVKSYASKMSQYRNNAKRQQEITDGVNAYNGIIQRMHSITEKEYDIASDDVKVQAEAKNARDADAKELKKLHDELETIVKYLGKEGITGVKEYTAVFNDAKGQFKVTNRAFNGHARALGKTVNTLNSDLEVYKHNLRASSKAEFENRKQFVTDSFKLAKTIARGLAEVAGRVFDVIDSRLINLQESTQFSAAAWRGLSPQEMNEWNNANRGAQILQNKTESGSSGTYTDQANILQEFGYNAKEAADQITLLNKTLMKTGSQANATNTRALQTSIAQLQALEDISAQEANTRAVEILSSVEVMELSLGKSDDERNKIQHEQLVKLAQISRSVGFSADYAFEMLKTQRNARFKGIVDKITGNVFTKLALNEYEKLSGDKLTEQERTLYQERKAGVMEQSPENIRIMANLDKRMGLFESKRTTEDSRNIARGNYNARGVAYEEFTNRADIDRRQLADNAIEAETATETNARAASEKNLAKIVHDSTNSLDFFERAVKDATTVLGGLSKGPLGQFGSVISSIVEFGASLFLLRRLGGLSWIRPLFTAISANGIRQTAMSGLLVAEQAVRIVLPKIGQILKGFVGKAAGAGIAGGIVESIGDSMTSDAIENGSRTNGTAFDKETLGAGMSVAGSALQGAALLSVFGPVGMAIGGAVGGLMGIYDNWDTVTNSLGELKDDMVGGITRDANGNIIEPPDTEASLNKIAENTAATVNAVDEQTKKDEETQKTARVENKYAAEAKEKTDKLVNMHSKRVNAATTAYNNNRANATA